MMRNLRSVAAKVHQRIGSRRSFSGVSNQRNDSVEEAKLGVVGWITSKTVGLGLGIYLGDAITSFVISRTEFGKKRKELKMAYEDLKKQKEEELKFDYR